MPISVTVYNAIVTNLQIYTKYAIRVQATTKAGAGPESEALFIQTDAEG